MQKITGDHTAIRSWAESLGGKPAIIDHPDALADKRGIRIDFPGAVAGLLRGELRPASWDEFFSIFDDQQLLLSYEEDPEGGDPTDWYRFERRDQA